MKAERKKIFTRRVLTILAMALVLCPAPARTQDSFAENHSSREGAYQDLSHYSRVFGHERTFRLYLPAGYDRETRRYPVIYFFHGWGGRYFKDDNAKLAYEKIKLLVDKYQIILVMWDGCMDGVEPDPYNIGNPQDVKFQIQMKDYFPELVEHIDSSYRTLTDRGKRGIIGFSMGGFMSLFVAGEYPDKVCADVSLAGSAELFMGYPTNMTLYPIRYTFANLRDVDLRIHNGNTDILYFLNKEVEDGARWDGKKIDYYEFPGGHMIDLPGETRVFEKAVKFITDAFIREHPAPASWSHYELYPDFSLWGWQIRSDKNEPGFIDMRGVSRKGFGLFSRRWLPDGPGLEGLNIAVTTPPIYTPGKSYSIIHYGYAGDSVRINEIAGDAEGRLQIAADGGGYQIGISERGDKPDLVFLDYSLGGSSRGGYLHTHEENRISLRLLNRGGENGPSEKLKVMLQTTDTSIHIRERSITVDIHSGQRLIKLPGIPVFCDKSAPLHAEPMMIKFRICIDGDSSRPVGEFTIPVWYAAPPFDSIRVDDGLKIGDSVWGRGNGNGSADAGENILIWQGSHRLRVYTEDPWVLRQEERLVNEMIPARWPDGVSLSSVIRISPDCPDGHRITFLGDYETKSFNPIERRLHWGRFTITVHGRPAALATATATPAKATATSATAATGDLPSFVKTDKGGYRFLVDGKPFLSLGAQLWNSSDWPYLLDKIWPLMKQLHANTLEAPVYWQNIEPEEGVFRFDELDSLILGARRTGLRLILLWFGSYKNGSSQYAPAWVLTHPDKYPRMQNPAGDMLPVLSVLSRANLDADKLAFSALMDHIRQTDGERHTVIMMQVENECGSFGTDRDYTATANTRFKQDVPNTLSGPLGKKQGDWSAVFGNEAAETFSAYFFARYVNEVAQAGKSRYALPMYVNNWLRENAFQRPGEYPSGGPVSSMLPIWKAAAPAISLLAPDIYTSNDQGFRDICRKYDLPDNPLFIPEMGKGTEFARFQFYALGDYHALGVAPYGIDPFHADPTDERNKAVLDDKFSGIADNYRLLGQALEKIAELQGTGRLRVVGEEAGLREQLIRLGAYDILFSYGFPSYKKIPGTGRVLVGQLDADEFLLIGFDTRFQFRPVYGSGSRTAEMISIEEGYYDKGAWVRQRIWNGDEAYHSTLTPEGNILKIRLQKIR